MFPVVPSRRSAQVVVWMVVLLLARTSVVGSFSFVGRRNSVAAAAAHSSRFFLSGSSRGTSRGMSSSTSEPSSSPSNKKSKTVHSLLAGKRLVSVEESLKVFGEPGVVFVDGSWFLKDRNGREEFEAGPRIPGARYFDIDEVAAAKGSDLNKKGLPHMMPPKDLFAASMDAMDISNTDHLIVYATAGCMFVHRALYQIQAMGHERDRVHLMDGSLEEWKKNGGKLDTEPAKAIKANELDLTKPTKYTATDAQNVVDIEEVKSIVKEGSAANSIIVDVRSQERFLGSVEEPRPGLRLGHMPGAKNLFFFSLLNPENVAQLKPKGELQELIKDAGIDIDTDKKIVISCGSGATACALAAALDICGRDPAKTAIYDGSWSEWGSEKDTPITKDPDE